MVVAAAVVVRWVLCTVHIRTNLSVTRVRSWLAYNKTHPGFYCVFSLFNWNIRNEITTILMKYNNNNTTPYFHRLKSFRKVFSHSFSIAVWFEAFCFHGIYRKIQFSLLKLQIRYLFCSVRSSSSRSYVWFICHDFVSLPLNCISFCFLRLIFLIIDASLKPFLSTGHIEFSHVSKSDYCAYYCYDYSSHVIICL